MEINQERVIEGLIFVSETPLKPTHVEEVFLAEEFAEMQLDADRAKEIMDGLVEKYESAEHIFELRKINGGYQFFTKRELYPYLREGALLKNKKKLSRAALETLAIIAYRQPVTKPEIEFVRGVNCDYAVQKLLEKKLIDISGRSDAPGKPLIYVTSEFFMEYFGLNDIKDLPKLEEFAIDEDEYEGQFKVFLEEKDDLEKVIEEGKIKIVKVDPDEKKEVSEDDKDENQEDKVSAVSGRDEEE